MKQATALTRNLLVWIVPFAIVLAVLGFETDWGRAVSRDMPGVQAVAPQPVAVSLLPEYRIDGGTEARRQTVDRVLFNPTRRPAPPAAQTAAGRSTMQKGLYALTGTTVVGNTATAFLREVNGGKSRAVKQGDTLSGMLVAEVKPDRVRLKQGDDSEDLMLKIAAGPKTTILPAPPAPPPGQQPAAPQGSGARGQPQPAPVQQVPRATPPAVRPPGAAGAQQRPGTVSVGEALAERRRAAREAAAAAQGTQAAPAGRAQRQ
jgi:hypothetical protein